MNNGMKYFLISLGVILLIIFGIVIFNRSDTQTAKTLTQKTVLPTDYTTNQSANMQMTIEGPINANENHQAVQIIVGPKSRTINVFTGYEGQIAKTQTFPNNQQAYSQFLEALNRAHFTTERKIATNVNPEAICPLGSRNHYLIVDNNKDVTNLWMASCTAGTFGGNVQLTNNLFQSQIPNYSNFVAGVNWGVPASSSLF